ncbi:MAG TPA: DUF5117 domain-containing protein, partial [Chryseolinea sp.]
MRPTLPSLLLLVLVPLLSLGQKKKADAEPAAIVSPIGDKVKNFKKLPGYFEYYYDEKQDKIWLVVDKFDTEFLYVYSLAAGVGSNDIGLDRGQLGSEQIVKFDRRGPKVLLVQPNYYYRALSNDKYERKAVEDAFAQSVLYGFKVETEEGGKVLVDATNFFLQDIHDVKGTLKATKQGSYRLDESRSAIYTPRTKNFPKNSEFEATLTFVGEPEGAYIRSVVPSPSSVTVREHHSFVELPDQNYTPRKFDPRAGYFDISYY